MLKKLVLAVLLALPTVSFAQTVKIGYIDSNEILSLMPEQASAIKQLESMQKKFEDELANLNEQYVQEFKRYQAEADTLSETIRVRREQSLQSIEEKAAEFKQNAFETLNKKQNELMAPIIKKINSAIEAVGKENSFTYILDLSSGSILFKGNGSVDVTPLVKAKLNLQ